MPRKRKVIVGIDPSFTRTGLSVLDVKKERIFLTDSIPSTKKKKYGKSIDAATRIGLISDKILLFLQEVSKTYEITTIGIESPSYGKFTNSSMAETGGLYYTIIRLLIEYIGENGIVPIRPKSVKMIATNNGNSSKEEVYDIMEKLSGCKINNLDESDAAAVALSAYICFDSVVNHKKYTNKIIEASKKVLQE